MHNALFARIAAVLAATLVTWLLSWAGVPVSEDERANLIKWLTEGITALGVFFWLLLYPLIHRAISRKTNPADTAKDTAAGARALEAEQGR